MLTLRNVEDVIGQYQGRSRIVLDYCQRMKMLVDLAKTPGFNEASWEPIRELIETDRFIRVGNFKEVMSWQDYVSFLTGWASSANWECSFKRITEVNDVVFLELEERSEIGDFNSVVNSMSVYEFNAEDKIEHIDIYLQMALPGDGIPLDT